MYGMLASVIVDAKNNRRASVQAAYNDTSKDFHFYTKWAQHSLSFFQHNGRVFHIHFQK